MAHGVSAAALDARARVICDLAVPRMRETFMLDIKTQWRLHGTCAAFCGDARDRARKAYDDYVKGLRSGDLCGMTWMPTCDRALRRLLAPATSKAMYHADMLVRGFLRHVMGSEARVVLAGSAGTAILMNKLGVQRDWFPNDIDIFVAEEKHADFIADAYDTGVLRPLRCRLRKQTHLFYDSESSDGDEGAWCAAEMNAAMAVDAALPPLPPELEAAQAAAAAEAFKELRGLVLPRHANRHRSGYRVLTSVVVRPRLPDDCPPDLVRLIRPINIVLVRVPGRASQAVDFPGLVRDGFDLVPCAVSVRVGDDFSFRCSCTSGTLAAVERRMLFFNPEAVACRKLEEIKRMVHRVRKYVVRGFTFLKSSTAILRSLTPAERRASAVAYAASGALSGSEGADAADEVGA
ncbi:unnamed protein product [Prorocentrum cordatum]|uniref:Uncharacterized protein n=1 Tax=Prorocentrum cordatum TaxID=2364126 RepID=A0ABN9U145_9DINO|nr:unnamed protein product [Polarella glacialis]